MQVFTYNLGLTKVEPTFAKFNYAEKLEYLAFMWGTLVMTVSGFLLWFNNFTLHYFPKWVSDAATAVHYYEAILATFAILIWHSYMVMFDPLGLSDGYGLDRRQSSRRSLPPFASGILPRPGTRPHDNDRRAQRSVRLPARRRAWSGRQFARQATREELARTGRRI